MASATVAEAPAQQWTVAQLRGITFIRRWVELFGEPPRAADLNPSAARNSRQEWRIQRRNAGDPETGEPFMSLNALKQPFEGSLTKAIVAAGFAPARPGPRRRAEVRSREVDPQRLGLHPEVRAAFDAARADARDVAAKLEVRDRQLAQARERAGIAAQELRAARSENLRLRERVAADAPAKVVRERVVDETAVRRARERAARGIAKADALAVVAREREREAQATATRLASRLERAEATINALRAEKAALRQEAADHAAAIVGVEGRVPRAEPAESAAAASERRAVPVASGTATAERGTGAATSAAVTTERGTGVAASAAAMIGRGADAVAPAAVGSERGTGAATSAAVTTERGTDPAASAAAGTKRGTGVAASAAVTTERRADAVAPETVAAERRADAADRRAAAAQRQAAAMERQATAAERRAQEAERRAVRAEGELRQRLAQATGQARRLTADEIAELRGTGPAGPSMFARAVADVAKAHKGAGRDELSAALRQAAAAAETWRGRL